jgi:hypothetical protein
MSRFALFIIIAFTAIPVQAEDRIAISNVLRPFTVKPITSWVQVPPTTGNSRVKFVSPDGTPRAECAVIVQEYPQLSELTQAELDLRTRAAYNDKEIQQNLSKRYNNVVVDSSSTAAVSGYAANWINTRFSVGAPSGEVWSRGFNIGFATTPGVIWTISCGGLGRSLEEANKAFSYWQSAMVTFHTHLKIQNRLP